MPNESAKRKHPHPAPDHRGKTWKASLFNFLKEYRISIISSLNVWWNATLKHFGPIVFFIVFNYKFNLVV